MSSYYNSKIYSSVPCSRSSPLYSDSSVVICNDLIFSKDGEKVILNKDTLKKLLNDVENLKSRIKDLETMFEYSPEGNGYLETKEHFETLQEK
jgi:hypothetical protein